MQLADLGHELLQGGDGHLVVESRCVVTLRPRFRHLASVMTSPCTQSCPCISLGIYDVIRYTGNTDELLVMSVMTSPSVQAVLSFFFKFLLLVLLVMMSP